MVAVAIAILILLVFLWIVGKGFPIVFRGCIDFLQRIFIREEKEGSVYEKVYKDMSDFVSCDWGDWSRIVLAGMIIGGLVCSKG